MGDMGSRTHLFSCQPTLWLYLLRALSMHHLPALLPVALQSSAPICNSANSLTFNYLKPLAGTFHSELCSNFLSKKELLLN
ncbi:hypothetical protein XENTR_v10004861 [Xenopus tropicalis]|nr:hypothetical protein XENTR_v10004861 [Xenopus tropicalis]